jgi:RNA polymerase sigma-70 factor, ECF subfamily
MTAPDTPTQHDLLVLLPRLRRFARVLCADLRGADDLVLETLSRTSASRSPPVPEFRHRLFAVMHRLHGKRSVRGPHKHSPSLGANRQVADAREFSPPATLLDQADADEMLVRFSRLPTEQREVLALVVLEGFRYTEIAEVLDVPVATVMSTLRSAREGIAR